MTKEEERIKKARALRLKRPIARDLNLQTIYDSVYEMQEEVADVQWFVEDEDTLLKSLDGDDDEAWEFKMAFSDLAGELETFMDDLNGEYVPDCFDDLFPAAGADYFGGFLGYDTYDHDYYGLEPYEYGPAQKEAEKRICRMTKNELLAAVGACLKVYSSYIALRYRYDCLKYSMDILREKNMDRLELVKAIEKQYLKAEESSYHFKLTYHADIQEFDRLLENVPQEYWVQ